MASRRVCPVLKFDDIEQCSHCRVVNEPRGEFWGAPAFESVMECPCDLDPDDPGCDSYLTEEDEDAESEEDPM